MKATPGGIDNVIGDTTSKATEDCEDVFGDDDSIVRESMRRSFMQMGKVVKS